MKMLTVTKMFACALLLALSSPAFAAHHPVAVAKNDAARAMQLKERLDEIRALDDRTLSVSEKRALRKEVKSIKKELAVKSGGIYVSVGAAILIALLLILLL